MIYITAYYVDAKDGRPATEAPLRHGPALPASGLLVDAVDRRHRPAVIIGRLPDGIASGPAMTEINEEEHQLRVAEVTAWRAEVAAKAREKARESLSRQVNRMREERLNRFRHDFGATYGELTLQLDTIEDRINWLMLDAACSRLIAAGKPEAEVMVRTEENITVRMTAQDAVSMLGEMLAYGQEVMAASWELKDTIRESQPEQVAIDEGWPLSKPSNK